MTDQISTDTIIHARGLKRSFRIRGGTVEAVKGIDLTVERGRIVGFLGPNGAGKSTTLKMLVTLLQPTDGQATVVGCDLRTDPAGVRRKIGYVAQNGTTSPEAKVGLELTSHAELYGIPRAEAKRRGEELLGALDLDGIWGRTCGSLSGGQRRRLDIVMGLIHRPELVFLDEPSTGLDPQSRANLWKHIRGVRDNLGTTVFLTTHYMDEADSLSDNLLVIDHGTIVAEGTSAALKAKVSGDAMTLTLRRPEDAAGAEAVARAIQGAANIQIDGNVLRFQAPNGAMVLPGLILDLGSAGIDPIGAEVARPTLEDVFLTLTGRSLRD